MSKPSLTDQPPFQHNYNIRGHTIHWTGTDTIEQYEKNIQNNDSYNLLKKLGWIDTVIDYTYNSQGFRCEEFDQRDSAIAVGCSFTEGVGLHESQTWPAYLADLLDLPVWNLGSGGGSIDTVFRILEHYIVRLNTKVVFILTPPKPRFEYCDIRNGFPIISIGNLESHESFAKEWLAQTFNADYNTKKTMMAIYYLCQNLKIPVFTQSSESATITNYDSFNQVDLARDLMHRGTGYQQYVANLMHQSYTMSK
jgi:hypothetical protein